MTLRVDGFPLSDCCVIQASVISAYQISNQPKQMDYLSRDFLYGFQLPVGQKNPDNHPARTYADVIKS